MLSSPGIGSGLDVNGIVSQLIAIEGRPLTTLAAKEAKQQAQLSAFGSLKSALSSFQSSVAALSNPAKFSAVTANLADTSLATVTSSSNAATGTYSLEIQTLAQSQKIKSGNYADTSATIGTGTLTIQYGTYSGGAFTLNPDKAAESITISADQSSLEGVRDAINEANGGISASIVNDGSGDRLVISSNDTGLSNALKITVTDDDLDNIDNNGLSELAFDVSTGGTAHLTETVAASDAKVIIDGITVNKASNTITDAIQGVTLNLLKADIGNPSNLTVARDTASVQASIQSFVSAFNDLDKTITDLSKFDTESKRGSILTGDSTVRSVQSQLRGVFNTPLTTAGGGLSTLSEIGITFQTDGTLSLDSSKLSDVINDPSKDISTLFTSIGKPSDSLVSFVSASSATQNDSYQLNITQIATQGQAVGNTAAALTINTGINDTLNLTVNGVIASITLGSGTYTADTLAAEIQSKINGDSAISTAGINVSVSQSAGVLNITSERYGSESTVSIGGGTAKLDLFGIPVETAGVDVAGTINGSVSTGDGQKLTGTGNSSGLVLEITGGATGARGNIDFSHGFATKLEELVKNMLEDDSLIDSRIDGINATIKDIGSQRESFNLRLEGIESRIRSQFVALDTLISSMTQTSNFLQQQLANLPTIGGGS